MPYLLATVGVAGIGGFVLGTSWGRRDNAALDSCSPNCPQTSVDHVKRLYLAANVSLGIGAAALSSAALVWAISPSRADREQESAGRSAGHPPPSPSLSLSPTDLSLVDWESLRPKREPTYGFGMYPTQGGAYAHFSGGF
jgi:hypothetical protein